MLNARHNVESERRARHALPDVLRRDSPGLFGGRTMGYGTSMDLQKQYGKEYAQRKLEGTMCSTQKKKIVGYWRN